MRWRKWNQSSSRGPGSDSFRRTTVTRPGDKFGFLSSSSVPSGLSVPSKIISLILMFFPSVFTSFFLPLPAKFPPFFLFSTSPSPELDVAPFQFCRLPDKHPLQDSPNPVGGRQPEEPTSKLQ